MNKELKEGDLYEVNPEFFKCLYARVIESSGGNGLIYFSDGTSCLDFREVHPTWLKIEKKLAYLAGPMRSHYRYNYSSFERYEAALHDVGYAVINPAKVDADVGFDPLTMPEDTNWNEVPFGFKLQRAIGRCAVGVSMSDELYLMQGWEDSAGARAELELARWAGIPVFEMIEIEKEDCFEYYYRPFSSPKPKAKKGKQTVLGAVSSYCRAFFNHQAGEVEE